MYFANLQQFNNGELWVSAEDVRTVYNKVTSMARAISSAKVSDCRYVSIEKHSRDRWVYICTICVWPDGRIGLIVGNPHTAWTHYILRGPIS